VIIATKGRPLVLKSLLDTLALQTVQPDIIAISACEASDVPDGHLARNVEVILGAPGLPAQRNRALASVRGKYDFIVFFDDDFVPSRYWIEHCRTLLMTHPDVVCVTGQVLKDGVKSGGFEWSCGQSIVSKADLARSPTNLRCCEIRDDQSPYGCNMAFRAKSIEHLAFDERLVLYGWLEDRDFGFRAAAQGKLIWTDAMWGVHLGTSGGRGSGLRFGYSQVVNPWYLMTKGSMAPFDVCGQILRGLAANTLGLLRLNSHVDRWGRLRGNLIGLKDIALRRWAPERAVEF
jgi:GT2 family glycosyltransferase